MEKKYASVHYAEYLQLGKLLDAQHPRSGDFGKPAHDEMLFIIIHQVYELWFKQIIHELESVREMFSNKLVDERNVGIATARLQRVIEIQKLLIEQIRVMETMTSLDFLDFRNYLVPASGFQSFQFRMVEVLLGLKDTSRITYNRQPYSSVFSAEEQQQLHHASSGKTMFDLVEEWLERIPFLELGQFRFVDRYRTAVANMLEKDRKAISETAYITGEQKTLRLKMLNDTEAYFANVLDEKKHAEAVKEGHARLSYRATIAALLINLYHDEPILRMPYLLLGSLLDIDELFTTWRYRHAQMVLRMLGKKMGTGGSSGYDYLKTTAERHHVFRDLHNISTLLIPRSEIPELPEELKRDLGFHFTVKKS